MHHEEITRKLAELSEKRMASTTTFIDRAITVSSSSLAFSLTFRASLIGTNATHLWLLKAAWISLAAASVAGVILHLAPASTYLRTMISLVDQKNGAGGSAHPIFKLLYCILVVAFPLGIIALTAFGIMNTK